MESSYSSYTLTQPLVDTWPVYLRHINDELGRYVGLSSNPVALAQSIAQEGLDCGDWFPDLDGNHEVTGYRWRLRKTANNKPELVFEIIHEESK